MTTRAKRTDANQAEICRALHQVGASVTLLSMVGSGVPDLLVGFRNQTYLIEVKLGTGQLNARQRNWLGSWRGGPAVVVRSVDEALKAIGAVYE
jgi:hypothetical protein